MGLDWSTTALAAVVALAIVCRHPALSRLGFFAAIAAIGWGLQRGWGPPVIVPVAVVGVLLAVGPARVVCFELDATSTRREPRWASILAWTMTALILADCAWSARRWLTPGGPSTIWQWASAVFVAFAVLAISRFVVAPSICDYVFGPLLTRPDVTETTTWVTDWFLVRSGTGRSTRMNHCVTLAAEPTIWRVSWWRLGTLALAADRSVHCRVSTGGTGLRQITQMRIEAIAHGPAGRPRADRRPVGIVAATSAVAAGVLLVVAVGILVSIELLDHDHAGAAAAVFAGCMIAAILGLLTLASRRGSGTGGNDSLRVVDAAASQLGDRTRDR